MPLSVLAKAARTWKLAGFYEAATHRILMEISRRRGSPGDILEWCEFRRELGLHLDKNNLEHLRQVVSGLSEFKQDWIRRVGREFSGDLVGDWPGADPLSVNVWRSQFKWRKNFEEKVRQAAASGGICVVGNSASLCGQGLGYRIDEYAMVVRFNRCSGAAPSDLGSNLDIWMGAPGFDGSVPSPHDFLILSGAETHWVLRDWSRFRVAADNGLPILTMPRAIWREAVEAVKAPPSAGFLLLGWLCRILGGWKGVAVAGIGTPGPRYHQAGAQYSPAPHHNFEAEAKKVARFMINGLERIV
jgi:hypothetical protein